MIPNMIIHFIKHKVYHTPGAYSIYSLLEWTLVLLDVWFDALGAGEVMKLQIQIVNLDILDDPSDPTNPFWCVVDENSNGWNKTGAVLALVAWVEKACRSTTLEPQPDRPIPATLPPARKPPTWGPAFALGSLIFLVQTFISDASTLVAWNWSGYPVNNQPQYLTHAPIVITCAAVGALLPFVAREHGQGDSNPAVKRRMGLEYAVLALAACVVLCERTSTWAAHLPSWLVSERTGFYAGCIVVGYSLRTLPLQFQSISASPRSTMIFGHAMLWYILLDVLSVVTVAYAFVPGGWLLRERGGLVISIAMALVVIGERYFLRRPLVQGLKRVQGTAFVRRYAVWLLTILVLVTWVFSYRTRHGMTRKRFTRVAASGKPDELFTAGIWTVHFGVDLAGQESQRRQLELIRDLDLDIIGLLESDLHRFVYGNRDLTRMLVEELGYNVDLGPGPNKHTWGAALLSRYPILESRHLLLPSPHGELAPAIHAKLLIANQTINVIVSHNGQEEDALDRQLQTEALAKVMGNAYPEPFVFLGYVVTHVGANRPAPYEILMSDGRVWDVEIADQDRWCEYIAFRNLWRVGYARVSHGHITDTELQAAKFIVPSLNAPVDYTSNEQLYYHTYEDAIPEGWRFPRMFRGDGVRGHQYHVFDGPISYWPTASFWEQWNKDHPAAIETVEAVVKAEE
ncbi:hypothetical protein QFC24_000752 [Naganishia onofrii]|uniref:Uncharacterized protein n=1 Tax=Naganishia onofrii TaxID=1851511 RepID=A0ACC2XTI3_9TREE|nr:hypothetical protein QFC24_000752 [Naganishia onofrii]